MKSYSVKFESFQLKIVPMGVLQQLQNSIQTLQILWPVYPIHTNSILSAIWRAIILPFFSSKYFYSCWRLENLFDLSFEYLSFSNEWKLTILFPSPLTFLQWGLVHCVGIKMLNTSLKYSLLYNLRPEILHINDYLIKRLLSSPRESSGEECVLFLSNSGWS